LLLNLGDATDRRGVASRLIRVPEVEVQGDSAVVVVKNGKDVGRLDFLEDLEWEGKVGDSADGIMGLGLVRGDIIVKRVAAAAPVLLDDRVGERSHGSLLHPVSAACGGRHQLTADNHRGIVGSVFHRVREAIKDPVAVLVHAGSTRGRSEGEGHKVALGGSLVGRSAVRGSESLFVLVQGNNSIGGEVDWTFGDRLGRRNWTDRHRAALDTTASSGTSDKMGRSCKQVVGVLKAK